MSVPASVHRSDEREATYLFRMSKADKELLKARATEAGLTVQGYLEQVALGRRPEPRRPGPVRRDQQELPLTG